MRTCRRQLCNRRNRPRDDVNDRRRVANRRHRLCAWGAPADAPVHNSRLSPKTGFLFQTVALPYGNAKRRVFLQLNQRKKIQHSPLTYYILASASRGGWRRPLETAFGGSLRSGHTPTGSARCAPPVARPSGDRFAVGGYSATLARPLATASRLGLRPRATRRLRRGRISLGAFRTARSAPP